MKKEIQLRSILDDEGHLASPQLPADIKNYLIDIDGTITDTIDLAKIRQKIINLLINKTS